MQHHSVSKHSIMTNSIQMRSFLKTRCNMKKHSIGCAQKIHM